MVGTPGSGKDLLVQAIEDIGSLHAKVVPKHTSRERQLDDGPEMICPSDPNFDLQGCDIKYTNFTDTYGIKSEELWENLANGVTQVLVVSNVEAINKICSDFGGIVKVIFVNSELDRVEFRKEQTQLGKTEKYISDRVKDYDQAQLMYYQNILEFDHVLIYAGADEDLFDQIFRLFNHYEMTS